MIHILGLKNSILRLEIYNVSGERVYERLSSKQEIPDEIDLSMLQKGTYLIRIYDAKNIYTKKLQIQ
jgi:hypothetical protein